MSAVGVEWLRVRDEVVAALTGTLVLMDPSKHFADTSLYKSATSMLETAAKEYAELPGTEPREMHYTLIGVLVCECAIVGMSEEKAVFALCDVLDEYLDRMN
jgi:hypothetical protein